MKEGYFCEKMRILVFILTCLSRLPLSLLFGISGSLKFVLLHVVKYRKSVVEANLHNAFPTKTTAEIDAIVDEYYSYLSQQIIETIKLLGISKHELKKRVSFLNPEVLAAYEINGRNVIIMMGHSGNWEWAGCATEVNFEFNMLPVYRRLKSKAFDNYYRSLRSRFGSIPVRDKEASSIIPKMPVPHAVAMLADHRPGKLKGWWTTFLNQPTPFFRGSEILAKRLDYDVVFAHVRRAEKGNYEIHLEKADDHWRNSRYALTKLFATFLEKEIESDPANWLWSHKRWKHPVSEESQWMD